MLRPKMLLEKSVFLIIGLLVGGAVSTSLLRAETEAPESSEVTESSEKPVDGDGKIDPKSACLEHGFTEKATVLHSGLSCRVQCIEGLHYALVAMPDGAKCGLGLMYRNRVCRKGACLQGMFGDFFPFKNE